MNHRYPTAPNWHGTAGPGSPYRSGYGTDDTAFLMRAAGTGAAVGATGAAALAMHRLRGGQIEWQQAAADTLRAGVTAGVATAAAAAVGRMFWRNPLLSVAATLATGTAVMYALQPGEEDSSHE